MDAKETFRYWLVGYKSVSSLPHGGRHRKAQALPLFRMVRNLTGRRKSGSGKEVSSRSLSVKVSGIRGHFSVTKWESEKHKSWGMPAEGSKGLVATDGSLLRKAGKWRAGGWSVVHLDYDEEMGPLHGMYGSVEAEFEVQLTAFSCLLNRVIGPIKVYMDNKGIIDGLRRGCIKPRAKDADFTDQNVGRTALSGRNGILVEVEHVKAHRTKKEKNEVSHF